MSTEGKVKTKFQTELESAKKKLKPLAPQLSKKKAKTGPTYIYPQNIKLNDVESLESSLDKLNKALELLINKMETKVKKNDELDPQDILQILKLQLFYQQGAQDLHQNYKMILRKIQQMLLKIAENLKLGKDQYTVNQLKELANIFKETSVSEESARAKRLRRWN